MNRKIFYLVKVSFVHLIVGRMRALCCFISTTELIFVFLQLIDHTINYT